MSKHDASPSGGATSAAVVAGASREGGDTDASNLYITFPKIWEDYADVHWGRQLFDGKKTLKYQLAASAKSYRVERFFTGSEHSFRLNGLTPGIEVHVQIRALVDGGTGAEWCPWALSSFTTLRGVETAVASVSSESLHGTMSWGSDLVRSGPTPTHAAVPAAKFDVKVRERGTFLVSDLCEKEFPPDSTSFVIHGIPTSTIFEVTARAVSIYGDVGKWCPPVRYLTLNPVELQMTSVGEDFAVVSWLRKDEGKFLPSESAIEELVMIVELLPSQRELDVDAQAKKIQVDAQTFSNEVRQYRLQQLLPGRSYTIRSRYKNSLGDWTSWSSTRFSSLCPVRMPDAQIVGHNFIQVSWQRADPEDGADFDSVARDVRLWEIRCTVGRAQTTMQLPVQDRETKLVNLMPGVDYRIEVRALTTGGEWGLWSEALEVSTLHRLQCRVDFSGETWIKLDWARRERQYRDNISRYHVQLNCLDSSFRVAKYFPATVTSYTFEGLKPGTRFHCVIQAFSDQRWGPWSEPTEAATSAPSSAQLIRRGEDFVQLRWNCEYYNIAGVEAVDRKFQVKVYRPRIEDEFSDRPVAPTQVYVDDVCANTYRVPRLPPFSRITVTVRCFDYCLQTWCDWGPEKEFRTLPSAMVLTHVGETSAEVSWVRRVRIMSAVSEEDEENGVADPLAPEIVLKYVIRVSVVDPDGQLREVRKLHYDNTMPTTAAITELVADTNYALQMSYLDNDDVWSSASAPLRFRTAPLLQITVLDVTEGACTLHWGRWRGGATELELTERNFRIVVTRVHGQEAPRQYNVANTNRYTVRELLPSTVYKVQISGALNSGSAWGHWSDPVFIFTTPAMEMELTQVGEDYAHVAWHRGSPSAFYKLLPNAKLHVVATYVPDAPVVPGKFASPSEGQVVYAGDAQVIEHHLQLFRVVPPPPDDPDAHPTRELFFESKLNATQENVRVPSLSASTPYEALVSACTRSKQWGCWSAPLSFSTSTPTVVRVEEITQDHIAIGWGGSGTHDDAAAFRDVWKFQLRIQGHDDEYLREVELANTVMTYQIKGLSMNACYSVRLRRFMNSEKDWGMWSEPIYLFLKVVPTEMVEVSQDWAHVRWVNKAPADRSIAKVQFLSLLGRGHATVVKLNAEVQSHIFLDLRPNTLFTTHLLSVEQSATYQKVADLGSDGSSSSAAGGAPNAQKATQKMDMEGNIAAFTIPVVHADFQAYLNGGVVFRTHSPLTLNVDRVGQNFVLLRWMAMVDDGKGGAAAADEDDVALGGSRFELESLELDADTDERHHYKATGNAAVVRSLKPGGRLRFAVRSVAEKSEAPCQWSQPVVARILPMLEPQLGPGDGTDTPGVGEDYLVVHWAHLKTSSLAERSRVTYDVRITAVEGPDANVEHIEETADARFYFKQLRNDTKYKIDVRTRIPIELSPQQPTEIVRGEWSVPVLASTLSPMSVAVSDIVEVGATVHWRRRAFATAPQWWNHTSPESAASEMATISSLHVRITAVDSGTLVVDEQLAEHQEAFAKCSLPLKALSPNTKYTAVVRSSTGMLWGAWSEPIVFQTSCACSVKVLMIGEHFVAVEWTKEAKTTPASEVTVDAVVTRWEVAFHQVATDAKGAFRTCFIECDQSRHCIGGLEGNTPYHVVVRPVYDGGAAGQWSTPSYFVTLARFKVDVGKVGETFVQVSWERSRQETVQTRMRLRHMEVMRAMAAQLEELEVQVARKRAEQDGASDGGEDNDDAAAADERQQSSAAQQSDEAPVSAEALLAAGGDSGSSPPSSSSPSTAATNGKGSHPNTSNPPAAAAAAAAAKRGSIEELLARIADIEQKMQRRQKMSTLQIAELERATMYPNGEDGKYELMVFGGAPEGEEQPFLFRRRLGKGELYCRLESLQPKTIYEVTVRSLYSNGLPMHSMGATDVGDVVTDEQLAGEGTEGTPWGPWSEKTRFATLKPIVTKAKSIGSECIAVEWDTGGMGNNDEGQGGSGGSGGGGGAALQRTAITKFQLHVVDLKKAAAPAPGGAAASSATTTAAAANSAASPNAEQKQRPVITLEDPSLKGYVVGGLVPNSPYSVTVRVCYEGDKWGVWSTPVNFLTMPKLLCKLQSVAERQLEFVIWRDVQLLPAEGLYPNLVVWKPLVTEHQLAINQLPCSQTFSLEANTSTLLTLDTLAIDTEYVISVKDRVEDYWQEYNAVLKCETVAYAPQRPTLLERKGPNVAIAWQHKQNLPSKQYIYCVEMALRSEAEKKALSNSALRRSGHAPGSGGSSGSKETSLVLLAAAAQHGNFEVLGYTTAAEYRTYLPHAVHDCFFRVRVCKTSQTTDGDPLPVAVNPASPQSIVLDHPQVYVWSKASTVAHFKTPSLPSHPTGLHILNLTHNSATLQWNKPQNYQEHCNLVYRVYLNNSYQERFTCIAETASTRCELEDLIPNCHYRVAVTAESTMGTSIQNNTLHFSTRVTPTEREPSERPPHLAAAAVRKSKPLTSTLPPRTMLKAPRELLETLKASRSVGGIDLDHGGAQGFTALLDDTASTVFAAARLTHQSGRSPPRADGHLQQRPLSGSQQRHRQLPPLHQDANATI